MILTQNKNNQQPQENQYKIEFGISTKNFQQKPTPTEIRKIQFRKKSIAVNEMANLINKDIVSLIAFTLNNRYLD